MSPSCLIFFAITWLGLKLTCSSTGDMLKNQSSSRFTHFPVENNFIHEAPFTEFIWFQSPAREVWNHRTFESQSADMTVFVKATFIKENLDSIPRAAINRFRKILPPPQEFFISFHHFRKRSESVACLEWVRLWTCAFRSSYPRWDAKFAILNPSNSTNCRKKEGF